MKIFKSTINNEDFRKNSTNNVISKVFSKLFIGLLVTAIVSFATYATGLYSLILSSSLFYIGLGIGEIALVVYLSAKIMHMDKTTANMWYYAYAALNGVTMSYIFAMFNIGTIFLAFACSALMFGVTALYGYVTKKNLDTIGSIGMMLLLGIIITTILNILIFKSTGLDLLLLYLGLFVFAGITAYDMQKIKEISNVAYSLDSNEVNSVATIGALNIYLDFINIFIRILTLCARGDD